jgi:hypothetical protein
MVYAIFMCVVYAAAPQQLKNCEIQQVGALSYDRLGHPHGGRVIYYQSIEECKKAAAPYNANFHPGASTNLKAVCMGKPDWQPVQ